MRIGVVANLDRSWGGIYQYAVTLIGALPELAMDDEFVLFVYEGEQAPLELRSAVAEIVPLRVITGTAGSLTRGLLAALPVGLRLRLRSIVVRMLSRRAPGARSQSSGSQPEVDAAWATFFARHGIELLIFTADSELAPKVGVPYIAAVHDIQHRLQPEFPEVSADGEWERRETRIGATVAGATTLLVDSEVGREDLLDAYGQLEIDPEAVRVLPFLPASPSGDRPSEAEISRVRARHDLPEEYLFYPAQFWPHKNHIGIVEALGVLAARGQRPHVVFAGTHSGALREQTHAEVMARATELGVRAYVHDLGYVQDADMAPLYAGALALVMPTFFGPTNIPVVEAWALACPVITSDIRGVREQAGGAAILVDPRAAESIAQGMESVITDEDLRVRLIHAGAHRLARYPREEYVSRLRSAIAFAVSRVSVQGEKGVRE